GVTIIQDCYNASPNSMKSAIDVITSINCEGKRVCVLGDMLELGDYSDDAHIEVGKLVGRSKVDTLICYGQQGKLIKKGAIMVAMKNVYHFEDKTALSNFLKSNLVSGDAVIFKASRGMKLEEVLNLYTDEEI
ncbi:MAG: cyanophycin synthetase, partial [Oscillospiraceae bacterium]